MMAGRSKLKRSDRSVGSKVGRRSKWVTGRSGCEAQRRRAGKDKKKDGGGGQKKKKKKRINNNNQEGPRERIMSLELSFGGDEFRDKQWGRRAVCDSASRRRVSTIKL